MALRDIAGGTSVGLPGGGESGGVILTENTEMIGTGHILERRFVDPEVAGNVRSMIEAAERRTHVILGPPASMVITDGKRADLVVLSDNPVRVAADHLRRVKVERTIVGGATVYGREG